MKIAKKTKGKKHRVGESIHKNSGQKLPLISFLETLLLSKVISKKEIITFFRTDLEGIRESLSKTPNQFESFGIL